LLGNLFLAAYSWETALEDLAWEPVLRNPFFGTLLRNLFMEKCSEDFVPGSNAREP